MSLRADDPDGDTVRLKDEVWAWNGTLPTGSAPVTSGYSEFVASGAAATYDGTDWNGAWSAWQPFTVRLS